MGGTTHIVAVRRQMVKTPTIIMNNPVFVNCNWVDTRWQ